MKRFLRPLARLLLLSLGFSLVLNLLLLASPIYMLQVYDRVLSSRSLETLAVLTLMTVAALAVMAWLDSVRAQLLARVGVRLEDAAAGMVLRKSLQGQRHGAHVGAGAFRDLRSIRGWFSGNGIVTLFDIPWAPLFLLLIALFHPWMGWLALAGALLLLALAIADDVFSRRGIEQASDASRRSGEFADAAYRNGDVVHAMGMIGAVERRWSGFNSQAIEPALSAGSRSSRFLGASKFARQALQVGMLGLGAWLVIRQEVSPGAMIAATIILGRAMAPIEMAIAGWRATIEARAALRRLNNLLGTSDEPQPMPLPAPAGALSVERVVWGPDRAAPIVKGVSFELAAGELLGLIGPSGAGKSTLGRLLVGVLPPASGTVRLDGAELSAWEADALGAHIGYLPQDVKLFDATVAENVARLADPLEHSDAIVAAAKLAGAHDMILRLSQGYETRVGPDGQFLSSGQRQLVGFARALFGQPRLVVLDEPNANLDGDGEIGLIDALRRLKEAGVTVVCITHRPSVLRDATRILVLQSGVVAEFGSREAVFSKFARAPGPQPSIVRASAGTSA